MTGPPCQEAPGAPGRCPAWCERQDRHEVHIKNVGSVGSVYVQLVCTEGPAAPGRLREPHVVLRYVQISGAGEIANAWLPAGEAGQLAAIFAQLGHRELAGLVGGAAVAAAAEVLA